MKTIVAFRSVLVMFILAPLFAGCMMNDEVSPEPVSISFVSIYNAVSDNTGMDILIDNVKGNSQPILYKAYYGYNAFASGSRNIKFTPNNDYGILVDTSFQLVKDKIYSMFIANEADKIKPFMVEDVWGEPNSGKAMIRVVNLSPDAPPLDLFLGDNSESFISAQGFRTASQYKEIEEGVMNFTLKKESENEIISTLPDIHIQSKRVYTLIIRGLLNPTEENVNAIGMQVETNHTIL